MLLSNKGIFMLKKLLILLLVSTPIYAQQTPIVCDIEIEFNSTGVGIDADVYEKIMKRITETPSVTEKHIENLGREGERTLCLTVKPQELDTVYEELKSLIPEKSHNTWTRIKSRTGAEFKTGKEEGLVRYPWQ